jgi:hypothetical protein
MPFFENFFHFILNKMDKNNIKTMYKINPGLGFQGYYQCAPLQGQKFITPMPANIKALTPAQSKAWAKSRVQQNYSKASLQQTPEADWYSKNFPPGV